jgi:hypothetical protein
LGILRAPEKTSRRSGMEYENGNCEISTPQCPVNDNSDPIFRHGCTARRTRGEQSRLHRSNIITGIPLCSRAGLGRAKADVKLTLLSMQKNPKGHEPMRITMTGSVPRAVSLLAAFMKSKKIRSRLAARTDHSRGEKIYLTELRRAWAWAIKLFASASSIFCPLNAAFSSMAIIFPAISLRWLVRSTILASSAA